MGQRREKLAGRSPSSGAAVEVAGAENRDGAVLAVVTRLATYLPAADPDDGLGEHAAACTADVASGTWLSMASSGPSAATSLATSAATFLLWGQCRQSLLLPGAAARD
jgi:hypothetical protein